MENSAKKTKRQKTIDLRQKRQQLLLLEKFRETHNVSLACKKADIPKATYYRWRKNHEFAIQSDEALQEGKGTTNDAVESALIRKALEGNVSAMKLYLTHNHDTYIQSRDTLEQEEKRGMIEQLRETIQRFTGIHKKPENAGKNEATKGSLED